MDGLPDAVEKLRRSITFGGVWFCVLDKSREHMSLALMRNCDWLAQVVVALRLAVAATMLVLAAMQPGLAATQGLVSIDTTAGISTALAPDQSHSHARSGGHEDGEEHRPLAADTCCDMHCVFGQLLPPCAGTIRRDFAAQAFIIFAEAVPAGEFTVPAKPPRT